MNNAGALLALGHSEWMTVDDYRCQCDVNLLGMIDVTMTFLPLVKKSQGRIVNASSIGGRLTMPNVAAYCVSKFGVEAFTDEIR